jgi:hypothetical protein
MAIKIARGNGDAVIEQIMDVLRQYEVDHPKAEIDLYRQNPVSVRARIVDPDFKGRGKPERSRLAWRYLEKLPDEVQSDISMVLLLTPDEKKLSFANFEFEDPVPSEL